MNKTAHKDDYGMDSWCEMYVAFLDRPAPLCGRWRVVSAAVHRAALQDAASGMIAGDWAFERWKDAITVEDTKHWHDVILTRVIQKSVRDCRGERLLEIIVT